MITAKIGSITKESNSAYVFIYYSDGTDSFNEQFILAPGITIGDIEKHAQRRIEAVNAVHAVADSLTVGQALDTTTTDQADIDKQKYFDEVGQLQKLQALVDLGTLKPTDPLITDLQTQIKIDFKPEYVN